METESLRELFLEELRDLYNAEKQIVEALPQMVDASSSDDLRRAFQEHLEQTKIQVQRLEEIFDALDESPHGKECRGMRGIIEECRESVQKHQNDPTVLDAAMISCAQKVEHYEMAGYGSVRTFAHILGEEDIAEVLQRTLEEEGEADHLLTEIAEGSVNVRAARIGVLEEDELT